MDNSLIVGDLNISELSDEELAERLKEQGFHPGPILSTTRSVYQRKLARLLRNESFVEEYDEEVRPNPGTDWRHIPTTPPTWNSSPGMESPPSGTPFSTSSIDYDDLRRRPLPRHDSSYSSSTSSYKPWSPDDIVTQATPPPPMPQEPFLSPLVKLAALVGTIVFVVFVYYNMESTPVNPFTSP